MAALTGLALALPVSILVGAHGFDGLYGQDSYFYQAYGTGSLRDALLRGELLPPGFTWPPGFPLLIALGSLLLGPGTLAGQTVSLAAGAAVPILTALLARDLGIAVFGTRGRPWLPLLAGAIVGLEPHLWQSSAVVMSDTCGLAFMTAGAWSLARFTVTRRIGWAIASAALVAFAVEIRLGFALVAAPLACCGLIVAWRARRSVSLPWSIVLPASAAAIVMAPMLIPMAIAAMAGEAMPFAIQLQSHAWDPGNALRREFDGPDGHFAFELPMGLFYLLEPARPYHLGPLLGSFALIGVLAAARRFTLLQSALLLGWPIPLIGFLAGDSTQNTRFMLAALPPIAILAAMGVGEVATWIERLSPIRRRLVGGTLVATVALSLITLSALAVYVTDAFIDRQLRDRSDVSRLLGEIRPGDRVVAFGATLSLRHAGIPAVELYDLSVQEVLGLNGNGQPVWLILPSDGIEGQWAAHPPGRNVAALRAGPGLVDVARSGNWHLYRIGSDRASRSGSGVGTVSTVVPARRNL